MASAECGEVVGAGLLPGPSVPLQWPAFRPRSSWRGRALFHPPMVVAVPRRPGAHSSPGRASRAVGAKRHPGQRASGFINFCRGGDGLFVSARLVLSIARPLFLVAASMSPRALLPAAWCTPGTAALPAAALALAPAAAALPGEGPPPAGTGLVPSQPRRDVVPL